MLTFSVTPVSYKIIVWNNDGHFNDQLKAKTEMLLSAEAAKTAQRADLESHLETAQHALQDKQQVKPITLIFPIQTPLTSFYDNKKSWCLCYFYGCIFMSLSGSISTVLMLLYTCVCIYVGGE